MKKIITLSCLMLLCSFAGMAQKFALIDMEYILKNIPAYEMTNEQLSQVSKKWQNEVEAIQQEAQNMYKNYQSDLVFLSAEMKKAPAAQLAAAGVDQDTGNPCFKQLRLPQVLESLQRTADCFGNRVQRVCLASQIQVSRSVQPRLDCFRPGSKFLLVHSLPSFTLFYLLDAGACHFVFP